jgi:hypothetical protein
MRYELTIDAEYLSDGRWDVAAGIREFMQNARDAEIEQNAKLDVSHYVNSDGKGVLVIENEGAVLAKDTLLLGRSTKRDKQDVLAGKWGEGYKLGALALLRGGYEVKIRNGGEVWTPAIEPSEKFGGRPVLVFNVVAGRAERNRVRVDIIGVSQDDWKALREHFLFLYRRDIESVETVHGTILLSPKFRGRLYVKGILVNTDPELEYGYDLKDAELDRDRRIIESYDLRTRLNRVWGEAIAARPDLFDDYYRMLSKRARDVDGIREWSASTVPVTVREMVAARFVQQHGSEAVPVATIAESKDIEHLGARGIIAPESLAALLSTVIGDADKVKNRLRTEVKQTYSWADLTMVEQDTLLDSIAMVDLTEPLELDIVDVVSFRSAELEGQFKDGRILVARSMLASRRGTLAVLVHELAHRKGLDGDKGHVAEIERIYSDLVERLRVLHVRA